jgi:hypothetical protein
MYMAAGRIGTFIDVPTQQKGTASRQGIKRACLPTVGYKRWYLADIALQYTGHLV